MPRLPQPGGDAGNWGQILNDYLSVEHNADGSFKNAARPVDVSSKYTKPADGIPIADLHTDIQTTLGSVGTKANQISLDQTNTRIDTVHKADGTLKDAVVTRATLEGSVASSFATISGDVLTQSLLGIGDSYMESPSFDWLGLVANFLGGIPYINLGKSGWSSSDIAVRQGGIDPLLTVTSNTIPASGSVTVTAVNPATSYRTNGSGSISWSGVLCGVPGTLTHNMDTTAWSFARTTSGNAVSCPAGSPFHCTTADTYRDRITIYVCGRNNIADSPSKLLDAIRDLDLMIAHQTGTPKRYIILGVVPSSTEGNNTARYVEIANFNAYLAARHPNRFLDIATIIRNTGLAQVGLGPTAQDTIDIAAGLVPSSLKADTIHLNDNGKTALARLVARTITNLGWVPGVIPVPELATATMITSDSFNRADSSANGGGTTDAAYGGTATTWTGTGEIKVKNNTLTRDTAASIRQSYVSAGSTDHRVSVKIISLPVTGANTAGVIARRTDASNYYAVYTDSSGAVQINKTVTGTTSGVMGPTNAGICKPGSTIECRIVGNSISAIVDGVIVLTRTDSSLTTGTDCGVRFPSADTNVAFDDFRVWAQ